MTGRRIPDTLGVMRVHPSIAAIILGLCSGCTGAHQMGEPWGSPAQFSTALPDRPEAPRDLAMFNGDSGRVLLWADLMRLARRSDIVVVSAPESGVPDMVRRALFEDVAEAFPPATEIDCDEDPDACASAVADAGGRRRLVRCPSATDLSSLSAAVRSRCWGKVVTTVALMPGGGRSLAEDERGLADVVVHLGPSTAP